MNFRTKSVWLVTFLILITSGVYAVYWLAKNGYALERDSGSRTRSLPTVMLIAFAVFLLLVGVAMGTVVSASSAEPIRYRWQLLAAAVIALVAFYWLAIRLSVRIARAITINEPAGKCSSGLTALLAVLGFSPVYLQYHINKLTKATASMK